MNGEGQGSRLEVVGQSSGIIILKSSAESTLKWDKSQLPGFRGRAGRKEGAESSHFNPEDKCSSCCLPYQPHRKEAPRSNRAVRSHCWSWGRPSTEQWWPHGAATPPGTVVSSSWRSPGAASLWVTITFWPGNSQRGWTGWLCCGFKPAHPSGRVQCVETEIQLQEPSLVNAPTEVKLRGVDLNHNQICPLDVTARSPTEAHGVVALKPTSPRYKKTYPDPASTVPREQGLSKKRGHAGIRSNLASLLACIPPQKLQQRLWKQLEGTRENKDALTTFIFPSAPK